MKVMFLTTGWEDYLYRQQADKSILIKINALIKEIERMPFEGIGKPELLKHDLSGWWSRRINLEHSLVYRIHEDAIVVLQCRYHY